MVAPARSGVGRLAITLIVALIVIIGGVATSAYLATSSTIAVTTKTTTGHTVTTTYTSAVGLQVGASTPSFQNGSCGIGPAYADSWLLFKHDSERTGFSSYNFSASSAGRFLGQLAWRNGSGFSEMAASQSELFVASYWLYALNLTNGKGLWTETTGAGPAPPIAADGNTVLLGENDGPLTAFNATTGANSQIGDTMTLATVAICGDVAYVNSGPGEFQNGPPTDSLQALNLTSGQDIWTVNLASGGFNSYCPTTDGHMVYMFMDNGTVFAYSASSGTLVWRQTIPLVNVTTVSTSIGPNGQVTVIENPNAADDFVQTPPLSGGKLFVTTTFGMMYALNATTGSVVWSTDLGTNITDARGSSAVAYGKVFEGTAAGLLAVNATDGSIVWKAPLNSTDTGTPAVVDGYVFIADSSGTLYQFNAGNGALLWSYTGLGGGYVSEPIVADGFVAVDGNNGVFAFR
jgi:outer membrane protein assembly factor BamB